MTSDLAAALREATGQLARAGVATARADAELLAGHVLGLGRGELLSAVVVGRVLSPDRSCAFATSLR
jgi:release factor glutamine methyltransferase